MRSGAERIRRPFLDLRLLIEAHIEPATAHYPRDTEIGSAGVHQVRLEQENDATPRDCYWGTRVGKLTGMMTFFQSYLF